MMKQSILDGVIILALLYVAFAFVLADIDAMQWAEAARLTYSMLSIGTWLFTTFIRSDSETNG